MINTWRQKVLRLRPVRVVGSGSLLPRLEVRLAAAVVAAVAAAIVALTVGLSLSFPPPLSPQPLLRARLQRRPLRLAFGMHEAALICKVVHRCALLLSLGRSLYASPRPRRGMSELFRLRAQVPYAYMWSPAFVPKPKGEALPCSLLLLPRPGALNAHAACPSSSDARAASALSLPLLRRAARRA
eukprot:6180746-Pleurochrysis_carterae.AAC.1